MPKDKVVLVAERLDLLKSCRSECRCQDVLGGTVGSRGCIGFFDSRKEGTSGNVFQFAGNEKINGRTGFVVIELFTCLKADEVGQFFDRHWRKDHGSDFHVGSVHHDDRFRFSEAVLREQIADFFRIVECSGVFERCRLPSGGCRQEDKAVIFPSDCDPSSHARHSNKMPTHNQGGIEGLLPTTTFSTPLAVNHEFCYDLQRRKAMKPKRVDRHYEPSKSEN